MHIAHITILLMVLFLFKIKKKNKSQIEDILASNDSTTQNEDLLASLTAWNRTKWAQIRNSMFNKGINRINLQAIESSAFVVSLDDEAYDTDYQNGADLSIFGKAMLHGNGHNRWFDKSFTVCIGSNGRFGFNAEHSWGDATILSHLWEFVVMEEITRNGYDENGNCIGPAEFTPPPPKRMAWDLKHPDIATAIKEADSDAQTLLNDLHLHIFTHDDFGKGLIKKCRLSPDAFLQMALQLAYYRDAGRFSLTYEATITRLFRDGRTETVRPVTDESATWVILGLFSLTILFTQYTYTNSFVFLLGYISNRSNPCLIPIPP